MEYILLFSLFFIISVVAIILIFLPYFRERKISRGIRNQDTFSNNYLFKVKCSEKVFLERLKLKNVTDVMQHSFDPDTMTVTFTMHNASISYAITVKEIQNECYVCLTKNKLFVERSNIPYRINEFMIKKFGAEPLQYDDYKNMV